MNKYLLILCGCFLLNTISSAAQDNKRLRTVTKGYYGIGNNARKLAKPVSATQIQVGGSPTTIQKGYYAIGNNNDKLADSIQVAAPPGKPVIKKGYYSIGNNTDKLRQ
jgi:hypothetical protein